MPERFFNISPLAAFMKQPAGECFRISNLDYGGATRPTEDRVGLYA